MKLKMQSVIKDRRLKDYLEKIQQLESLVEAIKVERAFYDHKVLWHYLSDQFPEMLESKDINTSSDLYSHFYDYYKKNYLG